MRKRIDKRVELEEKQENEGSWCDDDGGGGGGYGGGSGGWVGGVGGGGDESPLGRSGRWLKNEVIW